MSIVKKVISGLIEGGKELVKDSSKQVGETISPKSLVESALGPKSEAPRDEFREYLKNLGGNLTAEQIAQKTEKYQAQEKAGIGQAEQVIRSAYPQHLRPRPTPRPPSVYEQKIQEEQAQAQRTQKLVAAQQEKLIEPQVKKRGLFGLRRRPRTADLEAKINIKHG